MNIDFDPACYLSLAVCAVTYGAIRLALRIAAYELYLRDVAVGNKHYHATSQYQNNQYHLLTLNPALASVIIQTPSQPPPYQGEEFAVSLP